MGPFVDYLLDIDHLLIMVAASASLGLVRRVAPCLDDNPTWQRILPAMPIVLCSVAVWLPGLTEGNVSERLLLGLVLGAFCGHAHKLLRQTVFGHDNRNRNHHPRL